MQKGNDYLKSWFFLYRKFYNLALLIGNKFNAQILIYYQQMKKEYEMQAVGAHHRNLHVPQGEKPRTSSVIAADFQYLRQKMANDVAA